VDIHNTTAPPKLLRALLLTLAAICGAAMLWRLRPGTSTSSHAADADIVLAVTWLAWVLAGYFCIAVAASSAAHVVTRLGMAGQWIGRLAPRRVRRLVDAVLSVGVAASLVAGPAVGVAAAATPPVAARTVAGSALDWPGLVAPTASPPHHHHRAPPPTNGEVIVVQPGDTLWAIAARHLGPGASGASITAAWHAWYAENRAVIGPNPSLIQAGQRLVAPASIQH
jgi:nucleoid-associated protein YgaU